MGRERIAIEHLDEYRNQLLKYERELHRARVRNGELMVALLESAPERVNNGAIVPVKGAS